MSRSALGRCLRRHGVSNLKKLIPEEENENNHPKTFKDYEPGFVHADNGKEFTDRFYPSGEREPTGKHVFDRECRENGIEHRLIRPRGPRTNGMVERFNGGIREVVQQTEFESSRQLKDTLRRYLRIYNHHIPQKNLGRITPVEALKKWRKTHPDVFKKLVYNQSGLDT